MFQFSSVNVCICTSISWHFNKIHLIALSELKKNFSNGFALLFCKMTAEVSRNNCAKGHEDWKFIWYILDISKLAGSKLTRFLVCLSSPQYTPLLKDLKGWLWKCIRWKDSWTDLKRAAFSFNRKQQRRSACIQITYKKVQYQSLGQQSFLTQKWKSFIIIQKS